MSCPFKTEDADTLDKDALQHFTTVGDYLWKGIRANPADKYELWQDAMKHTIGDVLNDGDFLTIRQNMRALQEKSTGIPQTVHPHEAFLSALSGKFGGNKGAANFVNDLVDATGDTKIIDKLATKGVDSLDPKETAAFNKAWEANKNTVKRKPSAILETINGLIKNFKDSQVKSATPKPVPTKADLLTFYIAKSLKTEGAAKWREALKGKDGNDDLLNKVIANDPKNLPSPAELKQVVDAYNANVTPPKTGAPLPDGAAVVRKAIADTKAESLKQERIAKVAAANKDKQDAIARMTPADHYEKALSDRIGPTRAKAVRAAMGEELATKLGKGEAITSPLERAKVDAAYRGNLAKPKPGTTNPLLGQQDEIVAEARKAESDAAVKARQLAREQAKAQTEANRSPIDKLTDAFAGSLSAQGAKDWRAAVGEPILQKIVDGHTLTPTESQTLTSEFNKAQQNKPGSVTKPKPLGVEEVQSQMREYRKTVATELRNNTTPKGLEAFVARTLHPEGAAKWRATVGDDILNKIHSGTTLTSAEMGKMQSAFQSSLEGKPTRTPPLTTEAATEAHKAIKEAADAARAQIKATTDAKTYATFQNSKNAVSEQLAKVLTPEQFQAFGRDAAKLKDGDTHGLHNLLQQYLPKRILHNFQQATRAAMLSGIQNIGTIIGSHAGLLGVEDTAVRAIAAPISKGTVEPVNVKASLKSAQAGGRAIRDVPTIMKSGEGGLTLAGRNPHFDNTKGIRPEFTVGKGGKAANAINQIVRTPGRMHHSVLHVMGAIAHDRAISEMAYVIAKEDLGKGRITQDQFQGHVQDLVDNPTPALRKRADLVAKEQLLTNDNVVSTSINTVEKAAEKQGPVAEAIIKTITTENAPFNKIPSNIAGRGVEYTPAGVIKGLGLLDKDIPPEVRANVARAIGRGVVGTIGIAAGYKWMLEGHIVPPDPNKGERGSWIIFGHKVDINRFAPLTSPILLGALLANTKLQQSKGIKPDWAQLAIEAFPESPLSSWQEKLQNAKDGKWSQVAGSYLSQGVPTILSNTAAQFDPTHSVRQKNGVLDTVANRVPGPPISYKGQALTRQALPVKHGQTGETYPESGGLLPFARSVPAPAPLTKTQKSLQEYYDLVDALKTKPTTQEEVRKQRVMSSRMYSLRANELKGYFEQKKATTGRQKAMLPVK